MPQPVSVTSKETYGPSGISLPSTPSRQVRTVALAYSDPHRDDPGRVADGFAGVDDQVHDDLAQLGGVRLDRGERLPQVKIESTGFRQRGAKQRLHFPDEGGQQDRLDAEGAPARVGQHLACEVRRPMRGRDDLLDVGAGRRVLGKVEEGQLGGAEDPREQVVEIVRDARRPGPRDFRAAGCAAVAPPTGAGPLRCAPARSCPAAASAGRRGAPCGRGPGPWSG